MTQGLAASPAASDGAPPGRRRPMPALVAAASRLPGRGLLRRIAAAQSLLRERTGAPRPRPLARIEARRAALGLPFDRGPVPPAKPGAKPERDCDCVPVLWR